MENEEKGILVEQVVQADRIRTHGKFHERLFLLLRIIYFLIGNAWCGAWTCAYL